LDTLRGGLDRDQGVILDRYEDEARNNNLLTNTRNEAINNAADNDALQGHRSELRDFLIAIQALTQYTTDLRADAQRRGVALDDPDFRSLQQFTPAQLQAWQTRATELLAEVTAREQFNTNLENGFETILTTSSPEAVASLQNLRDGDPASDEEYARYSIEQLSETTFSDTTPTAELDTAMDTVDDSIQMLNGIREGYESARAYFSGMNVPAGLLGRDEALTFNAGRTALHQQGVARADAAIQEAVAIRGNLEGLLAHRTDARARRTRVRDRIRNAPPGRVAAARQAAGRTVGTVAAAINPMNHYRRVGQAIDTQTRERRERETVRTRLVGARALTLTDGTEGYFAFAEDRPIERALPTGGTEPDGSPEMETVAVTDPAQLQEIVAALNAEAPNPQTSYTLETDTNGAFINEVVGSANPGTTEGDRWRALGNVIPLVGGEARRARAERRTERRRTKAERNANAAVIRETELLPLLEEMRTEGRTRDEARRVTRTILDEEIGMDEAAADAVFNQAWDTLETQQNRAAWRSRQVERVAGAGRAVRDTALPAVGNAFRGMGRGIARAAGWTWDRLPSGRTIATAAGVGVAGLGVGAGLLGIAGIYGVTKLAQGGLKLGGEVLHQVGDKGPKLAKAVLPTIGGIIKAPFTMIASPFIGAWKGLKAGWNYPAKPQPKPAKGWTAPFRAIGNAFGWGWHKVKAAPTALATAALGLTLGGLWQGPGDAIVHDVLGVKTHMPVPAFMAPNGAPAPAPVAAPVAAPAAAAGHAGH
jgi:hypothetical protein